MPKPNPYSSHPDFSGLANVAAVDVNSPLILAIYRCWARASFRLTKTPKHLAKQVFHSELASHKTRLELYRPKNTSKPLPCVIFFHSGGFVLPAFDYHKKRLCQYAQEAQCAVLFVDYPLAPNSIFPKTFNIAYQSLLWLRKQAHQLNIDNTRIAVMGDSAGGTLAAAVSQKARHELGANAICAQLLIFPVLDDRPSPSMLRYTDTPIWNRASNTAMWQMYLKDCPSTIPAYAVPARQEVLQGLPPTYIESTEFDPLKDEAEVYAQRLKSANVEVTLIKTLGTIHGYDSVLKSPIANNYVQLRIDFLNQIFTPTPSKD